MLPPMRKLIAWGLVALLAAAGCDEERDVVVADPPRAQSAGRDAPPPAPADAVTLLFPYGSEKEEWLTAATNGFNSGGFETGDGRPIRVEAVPLGSGETMSEVLSGRMEAHIVSPASGVFIELANAESRATTGKDLVGETRSLVLSPVVIAMWRPMAEALGWPDEPVGWQTVIDLAKNPDGWAAHGHPEWGQFKFGHTHPEFSNSGLISVLAEAYAGAGKTRDLIVEDLRRPEVADFVGEVERAVVHYGSSTGFFGRKMFDRGPQFLSAAVLYENMVVEANDPQVGKPYDLPFEVVAIYPAEGTFQSDHPVGVVDREWVTDAHRDAAEVYVDYLLDRERQEQALAFGFRPGDPAVPTGPPIDAAHGVDPAGPQNTLPVPPAEVVNAAIELWRENKKPANVALVLDVSGSMRGKKLRDAKAGAADLIDLLGDGDTLSVIPFNDRAIYALEQASLDGARDEARSAVANLFADGGTGLYDAILLAHRDLTAAAGPEAISAVVVLSDGEDTGNRTTLEQVLRAVESGGERETVRVFTIAYGDGAEAGVLERISAASDAKSYDATGGDDIRAVFKDIATFF